MAGFAKGAPEPQLRTAARLAREHLAAGRDDEAAAVLESIEELIGRTEHPSAGLETAIQQASLNLSRAYDLEAVVQSLVELEPQVRAGPCAPLSHWLWTLGEAHYEQGDFQSSRLRREELHELLQAAGDPREASSLYNLAILSFFEFPRPGTLERYITDLREALRVAREKGDKSTQAAAALNLGKVVGGEEGLGLLSECRRLALESENSCKLQSCLEAMARNRLLVEAEQAAQLLADSRRVGRGCGGPWAPLYSWPAELEVSWGTEAPESAIPQFESVLAAMDEVLFQQSSDESRVAMFSRWAEAHQRFAGYLLREVSNERRRDYLEHAFELSERMRSRVLLDTVRHAADGDERSAQPQVRSLRDIEDSLAPNEALFSYLLGEERGIFGEFTGGSWLFVVTAGGTRVVPMPGRFELEQRVNLLTGLFSNRAGEWEGVARQLHNDVLAAGLAELPATVDDVVVVPDGPLHSLPFAAVARSYDPSTPLGITRAASATLWHHWKQSASDPGRPVLVLADPEASGEALERRGLRAELPFANQEARAIQGHLPRAEIRSGSQATESFVKSQDLDAFGVLHIAAHAVVDSRRPERSAILLTGSVDEDGSLTAGEVSNLSLANKLVVLSACSGASGSTPKGEGVMSLARAFFKARAQTVVASLWPLADDEAAQIFDAFYRHLASGATVAEALDAARNDLIEAGRPAAGWGGIVVLGNGNLAPFAEGSLVQTGHEGLSD